MVSLDQTANKMNIPMKQILLFFSVFLTSLTLLGQIKKVAMLEPIAQTEGVTVMVKGMVRGELTKSISKEPGFNAFTRTDIDKMMKELKFQDSGMVNDEQRIKLGQLSGADYVCVSKVTKDGNAYYLEAFLVHLESGRIDNPASAFVEGGYASVNKACQKIAGEMVGKKVDVQIPIVEKKIDAKYQKEASSKMTVSTKQPFEIYNVSVNFKNHKIMVIDKDFTKGMTKGEAVKACKNLNYGGYNDWRLPTQQEIIVLHQHRLELTGLNHKQYWYTERGRIGSLNFKSFASRYESSRKNAWWKGYDDTRLGVRCVRTVN